MYRNFENPAKRTPFFLSSSISRRMEGGAKIQLRRRKKKPGRNNGATGHSSLNRVACLEVNLIQGNSEETRSTLVALGRRPSFLSLLSSTSSDVNDVPAVCGSALPLSGVARPNAFFRSAVFGGILPFASKPFLPTDGPIVPPFRLGFVP